MQTNGRQNGWTRNVESLCFLSSSHYLPLSRTHAIPINMVSLGVGNCKNVTLWSHYLFARDWMSALGMKKKGKKRPLQQHIAHLKFIEPICRMFHVALGWTED